MLQNKVPNLCASLLCSGKKRMLVGLLGILMVGRAGAQDEPTGLLCNLLTHPEKCVITEPRPDFGWIVNSRQPNDLQSAFRILVASQPELLVKLKGDFWDSGKVVSAQSINVIYDGKPLASGTAYWWCVRTWNKDGKASGFSVPQRFNTGEFNRPNKKWPGESRWVQLDMGAGEKTWTFENRHPIAFHPASPASTEAKPDGTWFFDFGKAAFATLELTIGWTPANPTVTNCVIQIAVGEKREGSTVDPKPGGGIIYGKYPLTLQPGKRIYQLQLPRFVPHYAHSQAMPSIMPEVIPFRYCEVLPGGQPITVEAPCRQALWGEFNDEAAAFSSSNLALNDVYELCKYSVKVNTFNGDYASSQRERMMYEADTYIHQMSHYAVDREFTIGRYSHENMIFHASWPTEWISHSIFMAWADYLHTGNARSIARYYDELKPKTLLALAGTNVLISSRTGCKPKRSWTRFISMDSSSETLWIGPPPKLTATTFGISTLSSTPSTIGPSC